MTPGLGEQKKRRGVGEKRTKGSKRSLIEEQKREGERERDQLLDGALFLE
jgi:hypothetical protein